jgi:hypothetical protein
VIVGEDGAVAVDCKVRLAPRQAGPGPLFRSLRSLPTSAAAGTQAPPPAEH